jgi:hypothetical protein
MADSEDCVWPKRRGHRFNQAQEVLSGIDDASPIRRAAFCGYRELAAIIKAGVRCIGIPAPLAIPLALSASIVFEQSYSGVEGDSASSTELYALLSAIGRIPIRQGLAVTGSVDQYGRVQAIGGVNEKIEGFFDLCKARGLTGDQGVLIPETNAYSSVEEALSPSTAPYDCSKTMLAESASGCSLA